MRWTKLRKLIRDGFADSVRDRVDVRVTNADPRGVSRQGTCKEGTIVIDGVVVAHVDPHRLRKLTVTLPIPPIKGTAREVLLFAKTYRPGQKLPTGALPGEFLDFPQACWEYLNSNLNESLRSEDPFVSSLAVLNAKVGMQRLMRASTRELHPLTRAMLEFRVQAEREMRLRENTGAKNAAPKVRKHLA